VERSYLQYGLVITGPPSILSKLKTAEKKEDTTGGGKDGKG
jgi:hypothetical protein